MFKGLISKKFCEIQSHYYETLNRKRNEDGLDDIPKRYTGEIWTKNFMRQIVYYSLVQWQVRNNHEHEGKEINESKRKQKEVNEEICKWYNKKDELGEGMKYLFKIPLIFRYMKSMRMKEAWIRTVKLEYKYEIISPLGRDENYESDLLSNP